MKYFIIYDPPQDAEKLNAVIKCITEKDKEAWNEIENTWVFSAVQSLDSIKGDLITAGGDDFKFLIVLLSSGTADTNKLSKPRLR